MNTNTRLSRIGAAASLVAAITASGAVRADVIAQSVLSIGNFTLKIGNGNGTLGDTITSGGPISIIGLTTTADRAADLAGTGNMSVGSAGITCFGACGSFNADPYAQVTGTPTATYVGGAPEVTGDAISGSMTARTGGTVSPDPGGDGTASSNVNLNADFELRVGTAGTRLEVAFGATSILRAYLDGPGTATAANSWNMTLRNASNNA